MSPLVPCFHLCPPRKSFFRGSSTQWHFNRYIPDKLVSYALACWMAIALSLCITHLSLHDTYDNYKPEVASNCCHRQTSGKSHLYFCSKPHEVRTLCGSYLTRRRLGYGKLHVYIRFWKSEKCDLWPHHEHNFWDRLKN